MYVPLITSLNTSERRQEAATLIRSLIDKIVLTPDSKKEGLLVDLHGDLAGILSVSTQGRYDKVEQKMLFDQITELAENAEEGENPDIQGKMVAGGRSHLSEDGFKMVAGVRNQLDLLFNVIDVKRHKDSSNYNSFKDLPLHQDKFRGEIEKRHIYQ